MRRPSSWFLISAFAFTAACSKAGDKGSEARGDDTTVVALPANPMAIVTVLYNTPKDTAAFEKYYAAVHVPLVNTHQKEIGYARRDLTKFVSTADGKKSTFYRQAELYFNSMDDLKKGIATAGFKKVVDDLPRFATGGLIGMIATTSNNHGAGSAESPAAIVTVIYKTPKDTSAFEKYYAETHLPLVVASQGQIGFEKAELTKFDSNLDGSTPARYRQAELYFSSMNALKKGTATRAFKEVAGDLRKFATGGFDTLVGAETR
jgi:uncharacterized protein (TIGR02118 family)